MFLLACCWPRNSEECFPTRKVFLYLADMRHTGLVASQSVYISLLQVCKLHLQLGLLGFSAQVKDLENHREAIYNLRTML